MKIQFNETYFLKNMRAICIENGTPPKAVITRKRMILIHTMNYSQTVL